MMRAWVAAALLSSCTFRDGTGTTPPDPDAAVDAPVATWWNPQFTSRFQLAIHTSNSLGATFQIGAPVDLDGAPCSTTPGNRNSVRVVYQPAAPAAAAELDRVVDEIGTSVVWFRLVASIDAGATSNDYYIYCNNPAATSAPQNASSIFELYDTFASMIDPSLWATLGTPSAANGLVLPSTNAVHSLVAFPVNSAVDYSMSVSSTALSNEDFFAGFEVSPPQPNDFMIGASPLMLWWGGANGTASNDIHLAVNVPPVTTSYGPSMALDSAHHLYGIEIFDSLARFSMADRLVLAVPYGAATLTTMVNLRFQNYSSAGPITIDWVRTRQTTNPYPTISRGPAETYMP